MDARLFFGSWAGVFPRSGDAGILDRWLGPGWTFGTEIGLILDWFADRELSVLCIIEFMF